ncbi:MAG: dethiobiotin synthase [Pseudomonadota bacterium]
MAKGFFVTGTDTDAGKTLISCALLECFKQAGLTTCAMKPVASGCRTTSAGLRNDDALALGAHSTLELPYDLINPYAFAPPIAPHLAAEEADILINLPTLVSCYERVQAGADVCLVEGAGGWQVPINATQTLADLAQALGLPVILVVRIRLGCINHALLTQESILHRGLTFAGWVANCLDPQTARIEQNIATLRQRLAAPCLGVVPWVPDASVIAAAAHLDVGPLLT